jgi:hypothetical protein
MRFSEIFAQEFKRNFYVDIDTFPFKIMIDPRTFNIEKIIFETVIDNVVCVYLKGQPDISCSNKGLWFNITPPSKLRNIIKLEPAALKELFKKNKNLIYISIEQDKIEIFKAKNAFLFE